MSFSDDMKAWGLEDWRIVVGVSTDAEVIETVNTNPEVNPGGMLWTRTYYTWKVTGISNRSDALLMIRALNYFAKRNNKRVMSCSELKRHSEFFLRSLACKPNNGWPSLSETEFRDICAVSCDERDLIKHVHPHPQYRLFGRKQDMHTLLGMIEDRLVVTIAGYAGNGKTALAWHLANQAKDGGLFDCFDWVTDKRIYLNPETEREEPTNETGIGVKFDHQIIDSMIGRFRKADSAWDRAMDEVPFKKGRQNICRDMLIDGNYLLVIDNIETTPAHDHIIDFLIDLLGGASDATRSRAVITSRKPIIKRDVRQQSSHELHGIDADEVIDYIQAIQYDFENKLSVDECQRLASQTGRNPLFLQIAMSRYRLEPTHAEFERILADIETGKTQAFQVLFGPLVNSLSEKGAWSVARHISRNLPTSRGKIERVWRAMYAEIYGRSADDEPEHVVYTLNHIMLELKRNRIISVDPQRPDTYSMHPLIRSTFLGMGEQGGRD